MSEDPERITRRFLTPPMHKVHALLSDRMEGLGMTVRVDAAGNLRGLWQPAGASNKRLVMGSHIDTIPETTARPNPSDSSTGPCSMWISTKPIAS